MSRYVTYQDVLKRYPAVPKSFQDRDFDLAYIIPAEDEVDARLAALYTVPFSTIPGMVKSLSIDVTYYKFAIRTEEVVQLGIYLYGKDGKSGIFGLIADGTIVIDTTAAPNSAFIDKEYHSRFGPDDPINWRPDSDALIDACDERSDD